MVVTNGVLRHGGVETLAIRRAGQKVLPRQLLGFDVPSLFGLLFRPGRIVLLEDQIHLVG
jgi:hypothetical protein